MNEFFVVGCPRSGTTMIQQALNRHSRIALPPETKFFLSFVGHSKAAQDRHIDRLNRDLKIDLQPPTTRIASIESGRSFYREMANQYLANLNKSGVTHFGEKTPEHTSHLGAIREHFPNSKIIVVVRDGRDVALSLTKTPWMPGGLYVSFLVWLYYQRIVIQARNGKMPNLYFVRYENVVMDPVRAFDGVLQFLGLPYESAVADGFGNAEGIPEREYAWKKNALQKITPKMTGAFRRELDPSQIAILERLGKSALSHFDYPMLTEGRASLSPGLLVKLSREIAGFVWRMPLHLMLQEMLNCLSLG